MAAAGGMGSLVKKAFLSNAKGGPALSNFYTGKKLNGLVLGGALAAGTLTAMGGPKSLGSQNLMPQGASDVQNIFGAGAKNALATRHSPAEPGVSPSILAGARDLSDSGSQAPTLGATGDMVFGMHKSRKGMM